MAGSPRPFATATSSVLEAPTLVSAVRSGATIIHTFDQPMNTSTLPTLASLSARVTDERYGATARSWVNSTTLSVTYGGLPSPDPGDDASFWTGIGGGLTSALGAAPAAWTNYPVT